MADMKVPEVWIDDRQKLSIYLFKESAYQLSDESLVFPALAITDRVPQLIVQAGEIGTRKMLKQLRQISL